MSAAIPLGTARYGFVWLLSARHRNCGSRPGCPRETCRDRVIVRSWLWRVFSSCSWSLSYSSLGRSMGNDWSPCSQGWIQSRLSTQAITQRSRGTCCRFCCPCSESIWCPCWSSVSVQETSFCTSREGLIVSYFVVVVVDCYSHDCSVVGYSDYYLVDDYDYPN